MTRSAFVSCIDATPYLPVTSAGISWLGGNAHSTRVKSRRELTPAEFPLVSARISSQADWYLDLPADRVVLNGPWISETESFLDFRVLFQTRSDSGFD